MCEKIDFEIAREQIGALHAGRNPWFRTKDRILGTYKLIGIRKIKAPKTFYGISGGM